MCTCYQVKHATVTSPGSGVQINAPAGRFVVDTYTEFAGTKSYAPVGAQRPIVDADDRVTGVFFNPGDATYEGFVVFVSG